jgi:hypothetical protein
LCTCVRRPGRVIRPSTFHLQLTWHFLTREPSINCFCELETHLTRPSTRGCAMAAASLCFLCNLALALPSPVHNLCAHTRSCLSIHSCPKFQGTCRYCKMHKTHKKTQTRQMNQN